MMKKFRAIPPYRADGHTTHPHTLNKSGVYFILEDGIITYIGKSGTNLYKTMYRHFEQWHHGQQQVISYYHKMKRKRYTVRVILCTAPQATRLERAAIKKHQPRDNAEKYRQYSLIAADNYVWEQYQEIDTSPPPF